MTTFGLSTIGQIALEVRNLDLAVAFYRDKLGLPYLFSAPPNLAFFDCAGLRLMLTTPENAAGEPSNSTIYFKVSDIHGAYQILLQQDISFDDAPHLIARLDDHELWMAFLHDPDRNLIGIMCEMPLRDGAG